MKPRIRALATILSTIMLIATVALCVRSFFVYDSIGRSNWSEQPLTDADRAYGKSIKVDLRFVSRGEGFNLECWRGHLTFCHGVTLDPTGRWDENFRARSVNTPIWTFDHNSPSDHGYEPGGPDMNNPLGWLGFGNKLRVMPAPHPQVYHWLTIPFWLILAISAILPARWFVGVLRERHRRRHKLCLTCGYDLRGSPQRCPECGVAVA